MLAFNDCLLRAIVLLLVLFLILIDEGHQVDGSLANEDDLTIFDTSIRVILLLNNMTLSDIHRLKEVITPNFDRSFPLGFERDNRIVIEPGWEINVIGVSPMRQLRLLVKCRVPVLLLLL